MNGASATVTAAPPASPAAMTSSNTAEQPPEAAGQPVQSFTDVLSAQRAQSRNDEGERHDADAKRGPSHHAKEAQAHTPAPSSAPSSPDPAAESPAAVPGVGLTGPVAADSVLGAIGAVPQASTAAPGGDADGTAAVESGPDGPVQPLTPAGATTPQEADPPAVVMTALTEPASPGADVASPDVEASAARSPVVPGTGSKDGADTVPGRSARSDSPPMGNGVIAPAVPKSTSDAAHVPTPTHGGSSAEPVVHVTPALAETASVAGSTPTVAPAGHLMNQSAPVESDALRAAPSVARLGETAASAAASVTQQAASALDLDSLSGSISRPLSDGNGAYTVTVALHPPELGHVLAVMSLDGNDLQVALTPQTQTGHDALADATEALKNQLGRGGVNVNVSLRDPGSPSGGDERYRPPTTSGAGSFITGGSVTETPLPSGLVAGQIHLVL
jgi:Flagellar hook-length control protein FliK